MATKKKLAKSLAAKDVLEQLREQGPQQWGEWLPGTAESPGLGGNLEASASLVGGAVENAIGALQELCQQQQIAMPRYEFEAIEEGFRCTVHALGLSSIAEGSSKKEAKVGAAKELLGAIG
ncbi:MAG: hypothetical protein HC851_24690 [Acaryochloris sp. RU_4_1]|nr:hypothetical protein [Acaryochloris sp. RU_4_1]